MIIDRVNDTEHIYLCIMSHKTRHIYQPPQINRLNQLAQSSKIAFDKMIHAPFIFVMVMDGFREFNETLFAVFMSLLIRWRCCFRRIAMQFWSMYRMAKQQQKIETIVRDIIHAMKLLPAQHIRKQIVAYVVDAMLSASGCQMRFWQMLTKNRRKTTTAPTACYRAWKQINDWHQLMKHIKCMWHSFDMFSAYEAFSRNRSNCMASHGVKIEAKLQCNNFNATTTQNCNGIFHKMVFITCCRLDYFPAIRNYRFIVFTDEKQNKKCVAKLTA